MPIFVSVKKLFLRNYFCLVAAMVELPEAVSVSCRVWELWFAVLCALVSFYAVWEYLDLSESTLTTKSTLITVNKYVLK